MNRNLQSHFLLSLLFILFTFGPVSGLRAQLSDTTVYDYNQSGGGSCGICGSAYNCITSDNKSLSGINNGKKLKAMKVIVYHTACNSNNFYAIMNTTDTLGYFYAAYNCQCNTCFTDTIFATANKLKSYQYTGSNSFYFGGNYLCIDKIKVIRYYTNSGYNDAGINNLDSPYYACPGARKIKVSVINSGVNRIDSVKVNWKYNGVTQTAYNLKTTLDTSGGSGANKISITLGTKTLTANQKDTLIVWTSQPNGASDTINSNDTLKAIIAPSLGDTLTVGGTNPNYTTIQGAINALQTQGICKSVVVNIRPGTYNEQLSIGKILGTDSLNTVTFRSSTGDSSAVTIYYNSTSSAANYTLLLNNSNDIYFKQLTLEAQGTTYGKVIELRGTLLRYNFSNCVIRGINTTSTSSNYILVGHGTINTGTNRNLLFNKCDFRNGSMGIQWSTSVAFGDFRITNCKFTNQHYMNIYLSYAKNVRIENNEISRGSSSYSSGYGIYMENNQTVKITGNKIIQASGASGGIYSYSWSGTGSNRNLIANNFISVGKADYVSAYAWSSYYCSYTDFLFNNTYTNTLSTGYMNTYIYSGNNIRFRNNSLFHSAPGHILYIYASNASNMEKCNNNNYYSNVSGSTFRLYSTTYNTFADWQAGTKLDSASTWSNPNYKSATNLHVYSTDLNGKGIVDSRVTTDIDGQTRNSSTPDIGADEFSLAPVDAGVSNILDFKADSVCVNAVLKNNGSDTLKTVSIGWRINGSLQTAYSWSGTLLSGQSVNVCVGKYKFNNTTTYTVKSWTSQPNSTTDTINNNDTFVKTGKAAMSGNYTIGGSSPDYSTFTAAINDMIARGIIDSVKFKVRNGTYTEHLSIPKINGALAYNSIIFESENNNSSLVTLSYPTSYSYYEVVSISAAYGVTFRKMTIQSTTSNNPARIFSLLDGASNIEISNNKLISASVNSTDNYYNSLIYAYNTGSGIRVLRNTLTNGATGVYLEQTRNATIENNVFSNAYYMGLYIYYNTNLILRNNIINSNSVYNGFYGMYVYQMRGSNTLSGNKINGPNQHEYAGLYIEYIYRDQTSDTSYIYNNFISSGGDYGNYSFYMNYCENTYITHNNVHYYGTNSNGYAAYFYDIQNSQSFNNNFVNSGTGRALYLRYPSNPKNNYNNYFSNGTYIARLSNTDYSSIAAIKAAGRDSNSVKYNPYFNSNTDLHIQNVLLDSTAKKMHFPATDIDNDSRNSLKPDIGADEFTPAQRDAGVIAFINPSNIITADTTNIKVAVRNLGINTLYSFKVKIRINKDTLPMVSFNDTLLPGDSVHIALGKYVFRRDSINNLTAYTVLPNGSSDQKTSNDTFRIINRRTAMSGVYTIGGSSPDFGTFKAAIKAMNDYGIYGGVRFRVRSGTYTEQLRLQSIAGAGNINSVIFESENLDSTSVTLQYTSAYSDTNYVVFFNACSGITFRKMTINATGTSYSTVFKFENGAKFNRLNNNLIKGYNSSSTSDYNSVISSVDGSYGDEYNEILNNRIEGGSYGLYWYGYGSPNYSERGTVISGNNFVNQYYMGIYSYYQTSPVISNNSFSSNYTYYYYYGIYGIYMNYKVRMEANNINLPGNSGYGIYLESCNGYGDTVLVASNMVNLGGTNDDYGIYMYSNSYCHLVNNTIRTGASATTSSTSLMMYYGSNNQILNNIIENANTGNAFYIYSSGITQSDRNNFRSAGTNIGYWNNYYTNVSGLMAGTQKDSHSLMLDPQFVSSSDLHVRQVGFNGKASPHALVKKDIDGQNRNATQPDIGADEFNPPPRDLFVSQFLNPLGGIKPDTMRIKILVRNIGTDTIKTFRTGCRINRDTLAYANISRTIAPGDTAHVFIGKYRFRKDSINNLTAWTFNPNSNTDLNTLNDTVRMLNKKTAMSGDYTIGGSSPDFNTFKAAVNGMKDLGIVDYVRFRVRSGTYTEQISIPAIVGAGAPNSIIFESENLDSNSAILQHNSVFYDSNYIVFLNGASGVTFRKLRFRALNTSYSTVFLFENNADNNSISNNIIQGNGGAATGTSNSVIGSYNSSYSDDQNSITNNIIEGGSYGIYWYGSGAPNYYEDKTIISNNQFKDQYYMGISLYYQNNLIADRNTFSSSSTYSYFYPVYCNYVNKKSRFTSNKINTGNTGGYGIYLYGCNGNSDSILIANNMISTGGTYGTNNIYLYSSSYVHTINNTLKLTGATSNSAANIYLYSGNYNHILNNILENESTGYCMDIPSPSSLVKSNRNNFRTMGTDIVRWNGTGYPTISALKAVSLKDSNSLTLDPIFYSATDLHIKQIGLNGKGSRHPLVKRDIDNQERSTNPDIGADEFTPPALDAGIFSILTPKTPFPKDSQFVAVVLKNYGMNTLNSVKIDWKLNNNTLATYNWSGSLGSNDTIHVKLGRRFFNRDSAYSLKVWSYLPNSYNDTVNYNDTAKTINQYPALSGVYTIGGASPDFNTFTDATDAMIRGGIIGNVTFNVRNGTYSEKLTIPKIIGAGKYNSIIFQSENLDSTKVTLINSYNTPGYNYTLKLQGAVGVTFRYMTISATNTSYGIVASVVDGASYNIFTNNIIEGVNTTNTSNEFALINSSITNTANNSYNKYTNNVFKNGSYGIYAYGYASGFYDKKTVISNNIFQTPYYTGIYLAYNDTVTVTGNKMSIGTYSNAFGIRMEYCNGGYNLSGNSIVIPDGYMGIYLYSSSGFSSKYALVSNNMISVLGNGNNYGLYAYYSHYVNYYNNNIHISSSSSSSYAAQIYGSPIRSVNNIFDHTGAGYAFYNSSSTINESNNNCYNSNTGPLAYWGGDRTSISAIRSAGGMDAKSISTDPKFVSGSDLHTRAISLDKAGKALSDVKFDFDRNKRDSLLPDIGADEFQIPSPNDAGISAFAGPMPAFAPGSNAVKVVLNNYGSDTLKSVSVKWKMNGVTQTSYSWTGKIVTGGSATVTIGSYSFSAGVKYTLEAWPSSPNGVSDTIYYNDTLKKTNIYTGLDGTYTIGGYLPDFKSFAEANTALMQRGVIDTVRFEVRNGTYEEQLKIVPYPGSARNRPVTFASESGDSSKVTLKYLNPLDKDFYLIYLSGADNITFSRMTLRAYGNAYYNHVIAIDNEAKNNTVMNNRIIAEPSWYRLYYGYGYYSTAVVSGSDKDDSMRIISNYITGDAGILAIGAGTNSNQQETGLLIEGNKIDQFIYSGIQVANSNSPVIRRNDLFPDENFQASMVSVSNCFDNMVISHNKLFGLNPSNTGIGISGFQGSSSKKGNVFNNFISKKDAYTNGMSISGSAYCNISFNSINLYGTSAGNTLATNLQIGTSNSIELRNNILSNKAGRYAMICDNAPSVSNYNNLYTTGSYLCRMNSTDYTSLSAWKSASSRDANSKSVDPIFFSETDLHTTLTNLDSAATPVSGITDDIDRNTRNTSRPDIGADEFNSLPNNLAITAILNPVSGCLIDSQQLVVTIFNYGSYPQKNFPVRYRINGGTITTQTFTDSILPGTSKNFSFNGKAPTKTTATYNFNVWTDLSTEQYRLNDTIKLPIRNYSIPDSVTTMSPADSIKNLYYPISLSWAPSTDATLYDVYIWPDSVANRPSTPAYYGLSQIGLQIDNGLGYGTSYKWQVYARNPSCGQFGKVSHFTIRELPDLIVSAVSSPSTAFSGTNVSVSWSVKNTGKGSTGTSAWYDLVYFSNDQILDVLDPLLTGVVNATALNPGKSYSNSASVTLPNGIVGKYYIIVKTEAYDQFIESNEGNNISTDTSGMVVSLTPPPDLQVISVIKPGTAFSGQTINIQYTVKNKGTGITVGSNWIDQIYLNKDSAMGGTLMRTLSHNGALDVDSTYKVNTTITLPFNLSGAHYIIARTDVNNNIFEHAGENNNHRISDSIKIIQTPPPDLIVRNIRIKDSSSNRESVNLTYDLINQGGSVTTTNWTDNVYFSRFSTFNTATATLLASYGRSNIKSDDTLVASQNIVIPDNLNGLFYMYIMTDAYNQQFEGTKDTNNLSPRKSFVITTPDLIVSSVQVPAEDTSGQMIKVDWVAKNKGLGKNLFSQRQDKIYISRYSKYHKDSLTLLDSVSYYTSLNPKDSIIKTRNVRIPDGTYGYRYIYVYTDIPSQVYENAMDTNNYRRSDRIDVKLAPYPDLRTIAMQVPDTSEAGTLINVGYTVDNKGSKTAKSTWRDKVYISKDSVFNPNKVVLLQTNIITSDLMIDSSYQMNQTFKMQDYISAGNYYFFIYTDATDLLYEFQSEKNNIKRSSKVYVNGYPPIDLTVTKSNIPDSIYSGSAGQFGYTVKNIGEAKTWTGAWADNVYLSVDTFLDATDKSIGEVPVYTTLEKDSTYVRNLSFLAPNGFSGNYYVFFKTDWKRDNVDDDTLNNAQVARDINGKPKKMKVILSKSADLRITAWDIPSTAIAGQPATITWKTENKGDTTTKSGSWVDAIYLSTDYTIDAGDHYLGSVTHSGNMKKNTFYEAGGNYFLPSNLIGSYIVIIKTDNNNREYEHMAENNNTGASAMKISIAPPGDLVVTAVNGPSNAAAGSNVTVGYSIKNIGANPISGYRTDNIYLSADNDLDASDVLFASITESASMIPNSSRSLSASGSVKGVKTGNYYFIVFTDVKNNINESKDTNNTNASDIIDISIPELKMKTLTKDTLIKNKELYYRLIIPDSLEGESFIVTMKGDSINGINELYARFDEAPTRAEFDFGYSTPFYGNQELIIPKAKVGTYYLMAYGKTTTSIKQNITLYARKMEFEIRKVNPKIGGNNGQVTMRIDGSKFDENTTFLLGGQATPAIDPSIQMPDSTLHIIPYKQGKAHSTTIINPTLAYVTFNLRGYTPGVYDVIASKDDGNTTTRLIKGFTVVTGTPPDIEVSISAPSSTRANTLTSFQVMFGNYGTTDYVNGYLEIVSNTGAPVSLTIGGISGRSSSVFIPLEEYGGIKGLLKPGGVGTITVYTFSNTALAFNIILPQ